MRLVRIALVLLLIALVGPSAVGAFATSSSAGALVFRGVGNAPAEIRVANIQFALQKGDNATPINPDTRFRWGPRTVWAFWTWDSAKDGAKVRYVLRFGESDVAWGELITDAKSGRMEVDLERLDGKPFDIGLYRLYLDASGGDSGDLRSANFEIFDDSIDNDNHHNDDNDNGDDDDNGNNNANDNDDGDDDNANDND